MHAQSVGAEVIAEFQDVESGRRADRVGLAAALALCRARRATLLIAKLDRLARSVAFISNLMEGGVDFVAADMPSVNRLTVHVLAAVAEHEREMISQRTKAALAAAKAYVKLLNLSKSAVYDQLTSEYGGQFTAAEAKWAVARLK